MNDKLKKKTNNLFPKSLDLSRKSLLASFKYISLTLFALITLHPNNQQPPAIKLFLSQPFSISMASSLAVKRFLSSGLLSNFLLRPAASSASRSFNTGAMRQYDELFNDIDCRSFLLTGIVLSLVSLFHSSPNKNITLNFNRYFD